MERGIIFLLGGVAILGLAIFALATTGNLQFDIGSPRPASLGNVGAVIQSTHAVDIAADGALKLDGEKTDLANLPADLDRAAGRYNKRESSIDLFAAPGVSPAKIEAVRSAIYAAGWSHVSLSYQTGKIMKAARTAPVPAPPHTATSASAP